MKTYGAEETSVKSELIRESLFSDAVCCCVASLASDLGSQPLYGVVPIRRLQNTVHGLMVFIVLTNVGFLNGANKLRLKPCLFSCFNLFCLRFAAFVFTRKSKEYLRGYLQIFSGKVLKIIVSFEVWRIVLCCCYYSLNMK